MKKPELFIKLYNRNRFYYRVNFDINFDKISDKWVYNHVDLPYGNPTYDRIVNALISYKYPADKMQAVINNYLLEPDNESHKNDFIVMQDWRKFAKEYAKEIMTNF